MRSSVSYRHQQFERRDFTAPSFDSPAGLGIGPWLYPALLAYGISPGDWGSGAQALQGRLETLLDHIAANTADGSVHVVHAHGTLTSALPTDPGATADWQNEIHPTSLGYRTVSARWQPVLTAVFEGTIQVAAQGTQTSPADRGVGGGR